MVTTSRITIPKENWQWEAALLRIWTIINEEASWSSYGKYDDSIFVRECTRKNVGYPFGKFHINIKAVVETILGQTLGMDEALKAFNLTLDGRHHSGVDDAKNIAKLYASILEKIHRAGI